MGLDDLRIKGYTVQSLVKFGPVVLENKILNIVSYRISAISIILFPLKNLEWFLIITPNNVLY